GRVPQPLFEASAAVLRFRMRTGAYAMMLTPAYPKGFFGDRPGALGTDAEEAEEVGRVTENLGASGSATRPLVLGTPATVLLVVFLLAGLAGGASGSTSSYTTGDEPGRGPSPSPAVTDR
ncbi:membrane protein, partial [Streptomyces sp. NRRL WC-3753]